jgi:hypothetical protein
LFVRFPSLFATRPLSRLRGSIDDWRRSKLRSMRLERHFLDPTARLRG